MNLKAGWQEAIQRLIRAPFEETEVEIPQDFEAEGFGSEFKLELRAREQRLRAEIGERKES